MKQINRKKYRPTNHSLENENFIYSFGIHPGLFNLFTFSSSYICICNMHYWRRPSDAFRHSVSECWGKKPTEEEKKRWKEEENGGLLEDEITWQPADGLWWWWKMRLNEASVSLSLRRRPRQMYKIKWWKKERKWTKQAAEGRASVTSAALSPWGTAVRKMCDHQQQGYSRNFLFEKWKIVFFWYFEDCVGKSWKIRIFCVTTNPEMFSLTYILLVTSTYFLDGPCLCMPRTPPVRQQKDVVVRILMNGSK